MRLIDADALKKKIFVFDMEFHDGHHQKYYVYKEKDVDAAPTIDAVEVVRCKDCIYFDKYIDCKEMYQWDGFCADWARNTYGIWYCSRAERRSDE